MATRATLSTSRWHPTSAPRRFAASLSRRATSTAGHRVFAGTRAPKTQQPLASRYDTGGTPHRAMCGTRIGVPHSPAARSLTVVQNTSGTLSSRTSQSRSAGTSSGCVNNRACWTRAATSICFVSIGRLHLSSRLLSTISGICGTTIRFAESARSRGTAEGYRLSSLVICVSAVSSTTTAAITGIRLRTVWMLSLIHISEPTRRS
eukprot:2663263-Prymnesium_polylepis.1